MKLARLITGMAVVCAFSINLAAQPKSPGFHSVACFKVKPDSASAFQKFAADEVHKLAQGRVGDGELTGWYLLRSVWPQGESADCDYIVVALFPNLPHPLGDQELTAAIKKTGLNITPDDYRKHRDAVSKLVSVGIYQNQALVGAPKKGDFFEVSYMKVTQENLFDWIDYEKKVWKPFAEQLVKDGKQDGWSLNTRVMPNGADQPFQGVTVDVYPSMDAVFADDPQFFDRFRKAHPDMEFGTTIERFEKLRTQSIVNLYELEDIVTAQ